MGSSDVSRRGQRQLWLVPSAGPTGRHPVAEVAVNRPTYRTHAYAVPAELCERVLPGCLVEVPFGRRATPVEGLCVGVSAQPWDHTRPPVLGVQPGPRWLSESLIQLGLWISHYYACPPWRTFTAIVPAALRRPRMKRVPMLRRTANAAPDDLPAKQAALLAVLTGGPRPRDEALAEADVKGTVVQALRKSRLIETYVEHVPLELYEAGVTSPAKAVRTPSSEDDYVLTAGQAEALQAIRAALGAAAPADREASAQHADADRRSSFRVFLVFGVPGSGKTEVYVRAIRDVVSVGRQAVLLIPEIALTTQLIERFRRRFGRVAVLHSALTDTVRRDTLAQIAAGHADVIIGTRSAVFAPCPRLGLIVVDEEQEGSFKNLAGPYYHARNVAIRRAQLEDIPVVLGSATPSLETWYNVSRRAHYTLLRLPERVPGARLPEVRIAAPQDEPDGGGPRLLSSMLRTQIQRALEAGQQAILLHNRRGYAVYLRCERCGTIVNCERCGTHLVFHRPDAQLKCHHCGWRRDVPRACLDDTCRGRLEQTGQAIQRLEEELRREFPTARILRLDSDTMRKREQYEAALSTFESGGADLLVGTQMVAKGLDFPRVRLVGVIDADAALSLPDFRAAERVFQLIVQVVGRSGRREGASLAIVHTRYTTDVVRDAQRIDFEAFAQRELNIRQRLFLPPLARMVRFVLADARPGRARDAAQELADRLGALAGRIHARLRIDPPEPCVIPRLRDMHRYDVRVRGPLDRGVQHLLEAAAEARLLAPNVQRCTVDVDPLDLL